MSRLPRDWLIALTQLLQREPAVVRIVIAGVRGSAPREPGAFMLVGRNCVEGTIGGGRLEWESVAAARQLLGETATAARLNKVVLGADLGQCCGGVVAVWLERFTSEDLHLLRLAADAGARGPAVLISTIKGASVERRLSHAVEVDEATDRLRSGRDRVHLCTAPDGGIIFLERLDDAFPALWLYGAGHVGQALARILTELPLRLTWLDPRVEMFPAVPEGTRIRCDADLLASVFEAPPGAYFLVMTHSHSLDYALCQAILRRSDFAWLGLIGSDSKAARFRSRLGREGMSAEAIARLVCPIGIGGIESKWPAAIAVGVAAQVMQRISAEASASQQRADELIEAPEPSGRAGRAERLVRSERFERPQTVGRTVDTLQSRGVADCSPESCSKCGTGAS
jgi:xanthine dehydrogenase accessory factor